MAFLSLFAQAIPIKGDDIVGLVTIIMVFAIPIVAIMLGHQRKMAELYAQRHTQEPNADIQALRQEIGELKALVHEQTIALDGIARPVPDATPLHERINV